MSYYKNGHKVTRKEFIRLKQLGKPIANYDFLNKVNRQKFFYK